VAVRSLPGAHPGAAGRILEKALSAPGGLAVALVLPPLFLHVDHQPGTTVHVGSVGVHLALSDFCVLILAAAGLASGIRSGFGRLRAGIPVWIAGAALLAMIGAATLYGRAVHSDYHLGTHAVTAAKFAEYALLALVLPLLVRTLADLGALLAGLTAWSVAATVTALIQFFGADVASAWPAGRRQPSFLGHHDFAALSGATLALAFAAIALDAAWPFGRPLAVVAGLAGGVGLILSGSSAGAVGAIAAAALAALLVRLRSGITLRRVAGLAAIVAVVSAGVVVLRGHDFDQFLRWVGVRPAEQTTSQDVQSYAQRTVLLYIGWRIFLGHPIGGVGWQASSQHSSYAPYLADARRRFPHTAAQAFPGPGHEYGVQNAWVQALADLGVAGFALLVAFFASGLFLAGRVALRGPPGDSVVGLVAFLWLLIAAGVWTALGLVAGIPLDALVWLSAGLAVVAAAGLRHVDA
jgi:O-antigen ligase